MRVCWALFAIALVVAACDAKEKSSGSAEPATASDRTLSGPMTGVYKYTDKRGVVHYVDDIAKVPGKYRKKVSHPTGGAVSIVPSTSIEDILHKHGITEEQFRRYTKQLPGKKGGSHKKVILYTTSWCPACTRARKYLNSRGVSFTEKDVESSKSNLTEMLQKSGGARGVPVIDIHGKVLRGFNQTAIDRELNN
jgi:glutaredoxin-like YruB-family protein